MPRRYIRWIIFVVVLFVVGWGSTLVLNRDNGGESVDARADEQPTRTRVVLPAITPEPTETSVGWEVYRQNPSDDVPTIVHETCPQGEPTETRYRIQPGQRFLARVSTCSSYKGRDVIEVKLQTETDQTVRGYVVRFDSFEPVASE